VVTGLDAVNWGGGGGILCHNNGAHQEPRRIKSQQLTGFFPGLVAVYLLAGSVLLLELVESRPLRSPAWAA
jgi:hypothetical protein